MVRPTVLTISGLADIESGAARHWREQIEVVLVQQVARPERKSPTVRRSEADPGVEQGIAVDHEILRRAGARGKRGAIAGVDRPEELSRSAERASASRVLAAE